MTVYEQWDLIISTCGQLLIAATIVYAVMQFRVSQVTLDREIKRDTNEYLRGIREDIEVLQSEIKDAHLEPSALDLTSSHFRPVSALLNTYEHLCINLQNDFYDRQTIESFLRLRARVAWNRWEPFVMSMRASRGRERVWEHLEIFVNKEERKFNEATYADSISPPINKL